MVVGIAEERTGELESWGQIHKKKITWECEGDGIKVGKRVFKLRSGI